MGDAKSGRVYQPITGEGELANRKLSFMPRREKQLVRKGAGPFSKGENMRKKVMPKDRPKDQQLFFPHHSEWAKAADHRGFEDGESNRKHACDLPPSCRTTERKAGGRELR